MKVLGHELNRRLFFEMRLELERIEGHIEELKQMRAEIISMARTEITLAKETVAILDKLLTDNQRMARAVEKNMDTFVSAIESLPEKQKEFARLHYMDGNKFEKTADLMFYSVSGLHRIQKKAEKGIEDYINISNNTQ